MRSLSSVAVCLAFAAVGVSVRVGEEQETVASAGDSTDSATVETDTLLASRRRKTGNVDGGTPCESGGPCERSAPDAEAARPHGAAKVAGGRKGKKSSGEQHLSKHEKKVKP
eukprot:TRINITY_DN24318_c0_g1_i1.p1 TRINITY_DN24318_c0_g1~~TRINITY_DN24318_c0_g1_i1.p1  ORF type:complete len:112 (-),score=19.71 TRINITY_DN24318_c0_g1_i1:361-696(-)